MKLGALSGQFIAGRYRLGGLLGQGAMGAVYEAVDEGAAQGVVALKVVQPSDPDGRLLARIMREARLASRLVHPHVIKALDHGRWGPDLSRFYLVMELVRGVSLGAVGRSGVSMGVAVGLVSQVLEALAYVHARGVLHRDIKPDNILVSRDPATGVLQTHLGDFGLAAAPELAGQGATRLTRAGTILGTPAYMAPEQAAADVVLGPSCDLYAAGVVLFELLSGALPFSGTLAQLLLAKWSQVAPAVTSPRGVLPPGLVAAVAKMLAPIPSERYALGADCVAALRPWAEAPVVDDAWWQALGVVTSAARSAGYMATMVGVGPAGTSLMVGRDAEAAVFQELALQAESGQGQVVVLFGGVGIGKTALASGVVERLNESGRFLLMRGRTPPGGDVLAGLKVGLDAWLGTMGQPAAVVERALCAWLGAGVEAVEVSDGMALLRPVQGRRPTVREGTAIFVRLLRTMGESRPLAVLIDDLEPDASTAAFVEILLFELSIDPLRVLVVVPMLPPPPSGAMAAMLGRTTRAEGQGRRVMTLGAIDLEVMASALERRYGLPPREAARLARRSGGNPLYAEYLVAGVGGEATAELAWSDGGDVAVPETLRALVEAGLDEELKRTSSPERARALLEDVAVLQGQVTVSLLTAFVTDDRRPGFEDDLDALVERGLLDDIGLDAVTFRQPIARDVVLARVPERRLRRLHRRAVEVRRARGVEGADGHGVLGDHLAASGALEEAVGSWVLAFEQAQEAGRGPEVVRWGTRALGGLSAADGRRGPLALAVGRALRSDAELDAARLVLEPLLDDADADLALGAMETTCEVLQERLRIAEQRALVERLAPRLAEAGGAGRAAWLRAHAFCLNLVADWAVGRESALEALGLASSTAERVVAGTRLVIACAGLGRYDEGRAHVSAILAAVDGDDAADVGVLGLRALLLSALDPSAAVGIARQQIEEFRRVGSLGRMIVAQVNLGSSLWADGSREEGCQVTRDAHELATRFGLLMERARASTVLILDALVGGRLEEAETRMSVTQAMLGGHVSPIGRLLGGLLLLEQGRHEEARSGLAPLRVSQIPPMSRIFLIALDVLLDKLMEHGADAWTRACNLNLLDRCRGVGDLTIAASCEAREGQIASLGVAGGP